MRPFGRFGRGHRVRTPGILQLEQTECGAASLGIVLACFGKVVPLEELRVACGVSRDGSSTVNIFRAAKAYGLAPHAKRVDPEDLRAERGPILVYWEFRHFLVVEGFRGDTVYVNDPASGHHRMDIDAFSRGFTGVALTFDTTDDFEPGGHRPSTLRALGRRLGANRSAIAFVVLAGLALVVPGLGIAALAQRFVNQVLVDGNDAAVRTTLGALGVVVLLQLVLLFVQQRAIVALEAKLASRMSAQTVQQLLELPAEYFQQRESGDLAYRVSLNDEIAEAMSGELATASASLITATAYLVAMVVLAPALAVVVVAVALVNAVVLVVVNRRRRDLSHQQIRETAAVVSTSMSGVALMESIKASGSEFELADRWSSAQADLINVRQRADLMNLPLTVIPGSLVTAANVIVLAIGALAISRGALTIGALSGFQILMAGFLAPVSSLVTFGGTVQLLSANLTRVDDVLAAAPDPSVRPTTRAAAEPAPSIVGQLDIVGITFGYSPLDDPLIDGFDLSVPPGGRVALVGGSGSGKSTIARVVTGLYRPWSGQVLFDGRPRSELPRSTVSVGLGFVDQDIMLFEGTVRENVTLWDPLVDDETVVRALRDASIYDDVMARPGGIEARVAENGINFSGGERQRLEIARALLRDPAILVLDEATSALDAETEYAIDLALRRRACTCLIVAHRLSTIRDCDEIIVLEGGKVAQRGTHDQLLVPGGEYEALISA